MTTTLKSYALRRRGVTLVEIMASVLVLSVGLVGVLAAIPFGGFRMSQMREADHSSAVGRNAQRILKANGWTNPNNWWIRVYNATGNQLYALPSALDGANNTINLNVPFALDPLTSLSASDFLPRSLTYAPSGGYTFVQPFVSPLYEGVDGYNVTMQQRFGSLTSFGSALAYSYDRLFYQQDDIVSGVAESEDESTYRPLFETEDESYFDSVNGAFVSDAGAKASFTGRYSWMAFVSPKSSTANMFNCPPNEVTSADYDVVVFKDRVLNDQKVFAATVDGAGYQGGNITINLSTGVGTADGVNVVSANSAQDKTRVLEQLAQTRYLMLVGPSDFPKDGGVPTFAHWYKIANFSQKEGTDLVRLTLIGRDTPKTWGGGNVAVSAVFYPGAIGVYSGSVDF